MKTVSFELLDILILPNIRTKSAKRVTWQDTNLIKTGRIVKLLVFGQKTVLWNKTTIEASVRDTDKKFLNLNILIIISHCSYIIYTKPRICPCNAGPSLLFNR